MPRCKYRYYVTLLPCKQFHLGATGGTALTGGHVRRSSTLSQSCNSNSMGFNRATTLYGFRSIVQRNVWSSRTESNCHNTSATAAWKPGACQPNWTELNNEFYFTVAAGTCCLVARKTHRTNACFSTNTVYSILCAEIIASKLYGAVSFAPVRGNKINDRGPTIDLHTLLVNWWIVCLVYTACKEKVKMWEVKEIKINILTAMVLLLCLSTPAGAQAADDTPPLRPILCLALRFAPAQFLLWLLFHKVLQHFSCSVHQEGTKYTAHFLVCADTL